MEINEKDFVEIDTGTNNKIKEFEYVYYDYIDIAIGDPISSITLTNKYVIIGTMTGGIKLYNFKEKRIFIISKNNMEFISGLFFSSQEQILYASIGDVHYLKYEMKEPFMDNSMPYSKIDLYETNTQHNYKCEDSCVLMSSDSILKLTIFRPELQEKIIDDVYIDYDITFLKKNNNLLTKQKIEGKINSTNYYVPLDYDGTNFCWVEYKDENQNREICIQDISKGNVYTYIENKKSVDKRYGHINHAKLLKNNKILIIHNLNKCVIYKINEPFSEVENFNHIGDEVYSVDILYDNNTLSRSYNKHFLYLNRNKNYLDDYGTTDKEKLNENQKLNIKTKELKSSASEKNYNSFNFVKYNTNKDKNDENYIIITLDIDGNINKYENKIEEKLFNLYEINGIHQDFKDKKFFEMGYMYFIKTNLYFYCITTDHGCFIIKKKEK